MAYPIFAIEGGLPLAIARGISVAASLTVLGGVVFRWLPERPNGVLPVRWSTALALASGLLWLMVQTHDMASATSLGDTLTALPIVAQHTHFGRLLLLRIGLIGLVPLALGAGAARWRQVLAALLAGAAVVLQADQSHAASMGNGLDGLVLSVALHLLAAGLWLGQLPALWLFVKTATPQAADVTLRRFSRLGLACVAVIAVTAALHGSVLIGGLPGLSGTAYGWMALVKMLLFTLLLVLAAANRFAFMPRLRTTSPSPAQRMLAGSILLETVIGLLVILTAGILSNLPPGMHAQSMM